MPRVARIIVPSGSYHTTSRCYNKEKRLKPAYFKELFLEYVRKAQEKYKFKFIQFTIMDDHFHLIIQTIKGEASISRIMQYIKAGFAQKYNRLNNCSGPFWNERFHSTLIEGTEEEGLYFLNATEYIAYNPVVKRMCDDPREYRYSSYRVYFEKDYKPLVRIDFHDSYLSLGKDFEERKRYLLQFEQRYRERLGLSPLKI
jgi:putative transposase